MTDEICAEENSLPSLFLKRKKEKKGSSSPVPTEYSAVPYFCPGPRITCTWTTDHLGSCGETERRAESEGWGVLKKSEHIKLITLQQERKKERKKERKEGGMEIKDMSGRNL